MKDLKGANTAALSVICPALSWNRICEVSFPVFVAGGSLTISEGTMERDIEIFEFGPLMYFHGFCTGQEVLVMCSYHSSWLENKPREAGLCKGSVLSWTTLVSQRATE